jgi:hypothetical protein
VAAFYADENFPLETVEALRGLGHDVGFLVEAFEVDDQQPRGYRFAVLGDFEADRLSLFALVYEKIRTALAREQVRRGEFGWPIEFGL